MRNAGRAFPDFASAPSGLRFGSLTPDPWPLTLTQLSQPQFWVAVVQIIWIDIILSGDNAVVIAMACRGLPVRQRRRGMIIGAGVAAALLIVFTITVSALMALPFLRVISACALI